MEVPQAVLRTAGKLQDKLRLFRLQVSHCLPICDQQRRGLVIGSDGPENTCVFPVFYLSGRETHGNVFNFGLVPKNSEEAMTVAVKEKLRIRLKGYDHTLVDTAAAKIVETAKRTGARVAGPIPLPTDKEIVTILRAVHKYKDSREQFEMRTHKRLIDVLRPSTKTVEALQGLELPAGVEIEINL